MALHRAGPAIIASAATVVLGMLCLLFAEINSTKGLGPVAAIGIASACRHADAAAGAAGHLRPVDLLAAAAERRLRRTDRDRPLGPRRRPHRPAPAQRVGRHRARPRRRRARRRPARRDRPDQQGVVPRTPGLHRRRGGPRPALPGRRRQSASSSSARAGAAARDRAAFAGVPGIDPASITRAGRQGRLRVHAGAR